MTDDEVGFWGNSRPERRAQARSDNRAEQELALRDAIRGLLWDGEHVRVVVPDAWTFGSRGRCAVAVTGARVFVVAWNRDGQQKETTVADRDAVTARIVGEAEGLRLIGPWGRMTLYGATTARAELMVDVINRQRDDTEHDR